MLGEGFNGIDMVPTAGANNYQIESLSELPSKIVGFFQYIIDMVVSVYQAMTEFYNMLNEFDERIVSMVESTGGSEFVGMPVVEAISTFRYLVGDVVFYLIYMLVLFGCLWTIFKILVLVYEAVEAIFESLQKANSTSALSTLASKFFH